MPRRKRPKSRSPLSPSSTSSNPANPSTSSSSTAAPASGPSDDAVTRFAAALRASEEREAAERERQRAERQRADELDTARRELDRAIEQVRTARRTGSGVAEADDTWRRAKARVIELETGAPPEWADPGETDPGETTPAETGPDTDERG